MRFQFLILLLGITSITSAYQQYCRCQCNTQHLVRPIDKCGLCTKEFCLEEDPKLCAYTQTGAKEKPDDVPGQSSIIISCYQLESRKERAIIYLFVLVVLLMLGYTVVKGRLSRNN